MKPSTFRSAGSGFSLIELLVTIGILAIVLVMAVQITESAKNSIRLAETISNNDAVARKVFDQISRDVSSMQTCGFARIEFRTNSGNDDITFLCNTPGFTDAGRPGKRGISLINYAISNDGSGGERLIRGTRGYDFDDSLKLDPDQPFKAIAADSRMVVSENVIRFEVEYLIEEMNLSNPAEPRVTITREITAPATPENLRGLVLTLVTVDAWTRHVLRPERLQDIAGKFPDATKDSNTLETWSRTRDDLARSGISGYPREALQFIRCYQRTVLTP